jgi:hypothetical protein
MPELPGERNHGAADGVMLVSSLCVAVATWYYLASHLNMSTAPAWKCYGGVGLTFFLTLAGLTRRADWADRIRFLMGIWTIAVPFLLGLSMRVSTLWIYLAMGILLTTLSVPGVIGRKGRHVVR